MIRRPQRSTRTDTLFPYTTLVRSGVVTFGTMGLLRTILTLGLIPLGAFGAYRLAGSTGSRHAQVAALLIYIDNPLPYNALANGRWGARSEERRVGKECVSPCRSLCSPSH